MASAKPATREPRAAEDLQRASLAVQYEVITLASTHEMLQELGANWESASREKAQSNALLHAFLLAARSLLAFLYSHNARPSDIIAEDFFDDPEEWRRKRPIPEPELASGELAGQISKCLAHLTWARAEATKPLWGPFKIAWNIGSVLQSFLRLVDKERVHLQLREDVAVIMMRLEAQMGPWGGLSGNMAPFSEIIEFDDATYFSPESEAEGGD